MRQASFTRWMPRWRSARAIRYGVPRIPAATEAEKEFLHVFREKEVPDEVSEYRVEDAKAATPLGLPASSPLQVLPRHRERPGGSSAAGQ